MLNMIKHVEHMLSEYNDNKNKLKVLEYELARITPPMRPEEIEGHVLAHPDMERVSGSGVGDKTSDLVIEHFDLQRSSQYHALVTIISGLRSEINRLDYYLSLLSKEEDEILRMFYFENMCLDRIVKQGTVSLRTVCRRKKKGVEKLAGFYTTCFELGPRQEMDFQKTRFIGYLHEERFLEYKDKLGVKEESAAALAVLYLLTGSNEFWIAGVDKLYNFERCELAPEKPALSENGEKLWRLAAMISQGLHRYNILFVIRTVLSGLQHLNLELAVEAIQIAMELST